MNEESNYEECVTITSSEESCDSDQIDSDIEAELYSVVHHEAAATKTSINLSNQQTPKITVVSSSKITPNKSLFIRHQFPNSDLYTSFETPQVKRTNDFNNKNVKKENDMLVSYSNTTSFETPEITVTNDYSNRNIKKESDDVSLNDDVISFKRIKMESKENSRKGSGETSASNVNVECDTSDNDNFISLV